MWDWIKKILLPRGGVGGIRVVLGNALKNLFKSNDKKSGEK
jgi:hypothetical protein